MSSIFHYTTRTNLASILAIGFIKPASAGVPSDEVPAVWLSAAEKWEQTASKGIIVDGKRRTATLKEMIKIDRYVARIEIDPSRVEIISKSDFKSLLKMSAATYNFLVKGGQAMGARPFEWSAVAGSIPSTAFIRIETAGTAAPIKWIDVGWKRREALNQSGEFLIDARS